VRIKGSLSNYGVKWSPRLALPRFVLEKQAVISSLGYFLLLSPIKSALSMMGLIEEHYRLPPTPISDETRLKLKAVLIEMELI